MANSKNKSSVLEDKRYHNTWKLLSHYRDVVWSMEVSVEELRNEFKLEYKTNIDDFLESVYMAGADLSGTQVERHARTISRSNEMLKLVNRAVEVLRTKHKYGEKYYWVLFYTFLSPQQYESADELVAQLKPHIHDISRPTYFRIRRKAVDAVSPILWGYSSRECISILDEFFPEGSQT